MLRTPQDVKRQEISQINERFLGETITRLEPLSICTSESLNDDFTATDFSFQITGPDNKIISIEGAKGKGFVDGLFGGLKNNFSDKYQSLEKIKLVDINVNPIMSQSKIKMRTDAQASVVFVLEVGKRGLAEFQHQSRSMIYSCFVATLNAFEFYINCERCFHKIQFSIEDAKLRNRSDIIEKCKYDLSKLTEFNSYERKKEN